jgi:APA family basic amino acid/polyamine antiporter
VVALSVFSGIALLLLVLAGFTPDILNTLGDIYAFGATTSYTLVFIAALRLRFTDPDTPRPFLMPWNFTVRRGGRPVQISVVNLFGIVGILAILTMVIITHPIGRIAGPVWILLGLGLFFVFRRQRQLPLVHSVKREWAPMLLDVYRESGDEALAEEYERNLRRSARAEGRLAGATTPGEGDIRRPAP